MSAPASDKKSDKKTVEDAQCGQERANNIPSVSRNKKTDKVGRAEAGRHEKNDDSSCTVGGETGVQKKSKKVRGCSKDSGATNTLACDQNSTACSSTSRDVTDSRRSTARCSGGSAKEKTTKASCNNSNDKGGFPTVVTATNSTVSDVGSQHEDKQTLSPKPPTVKRRKTIRKLPCIETSPKPPVLLDRLLDTMKAKSGVSNVPSVKTTTQLPVAQAMNGILPAVHAHSLGKQSATPKSSVSTPSLHDKKTGEPSTTKGLSPIADVTIKKEGNETCAPALKSPLLHAQQNASKEKRLSAGRKFSNEKENAAASRRMTSA
ncbi:hypothetical protein (fragment), partial [Trypanosoma vivax Y486]